MIVSATLVTLVIRVIRLRPRDARLLAFPGALLVLLVAQLTLGILTVLLRKPADVASAHVAVGALVLMTAFLLSMTLVRLYRPRVEATRPAFQPVFAGTPPIGAPAGTFDAFSATRATS